MPKYLLARLMGIVESLLGTKVRMRCFIPHWLEWDDQCDTLVA